MFCAECGRKLNPGDKFCSACGTRVPVSESYHAVPSPHNARDVIYRQPETPPVRRCGGCGRIMDQGDLFCMDCGWKYGDAPRNTRQQSGAAKPVKKKSGKMRTWGIILIVLELIAVMGSLEELGSMHPAELLGFLCPGIIGVVLLAKAHNKNKE